MGKIEIVRNNGSRFSWFFGKERAGEEPSRVVAMRPASRDLSAGFTANEDALTGLYHGNYRGLQFASPLAFTPINLPVQMMGFPTPHSDDKRTQAVLDEVVAAMAVQFPRLHRQVLLCGNAWRWPRFDAELMAPAWDIIPDKTVSDILVDIATGRMNAVLTHEKIKLSVGENKTINAERKRRFDRQQVAVKWVGERAASAQDFTARNVSGILPVLFAHDVDEDGIRGYSVLARIIRDLKDYHDIDFRSSETLAKFRVKQMQKVKSASDWLQNNFGTTERSALQHLDIADNDFIMNVAEEETEFVFLPGEAMTALERALERKFWKIVEGSGVPELFWGPLATGNHASTDSQRQQAVGYVDDLRRELNSAYYHLFLGTLAVLSVARMESYAPFKMGWNRLEAISPDLKSQILLRFAQSAMTLMSSATCSPPQLYELWKLNFPESNPGPFKTWWEGLKTMAVHKQFVGEMYGAGLEDFGAGLGEKPGTDEEAEA